MAEARARELPLARRQRWLGGYRFGLRLNEYGRVMSVADGVAWIEGLPTAGLDDIVVLEGGIEALVYHLAPERIGAILLDGGRALTAGARAALTDRRLEIGVGDSLLGRVVDPLGRPLDGADAPQTVLKRLLDATSPPLIERDFVQRPLYTGNRVLDTLIPIGRGQRQLLIGDSGTGKTAIALDIVLRQRDENVRCVYVLIGRKRSDVAAIVATLRARDALAYTAVVVAEASALPGMKYLAPFAGCAIAEAWMEAGHDTLVVYDDLTTHAQAYRELSLLLRRPPGREAYPGDIFYLHARLLERATARASGKGGGSLTALPIVQTEQGEIADYIPTNLISITDGQVFLDARLVAQGQMPAIDVSRSVSRIGGKAQIRNMRDEAGRMKLDYLQFLELEVFTRFGAKLDAGMEQRIRRGRVLRQIFRQTRLAPWPATAQLAWVVAYNEGCFDGDDADAIERKLARLLAASGNDAAALTRALDEWRQQVRAWVAAPDDAPAAQAGTG